MSTCDAKARFTLANGRMVPLMVQVNQHLRMGVSTKASTSMVLCTAQGEKHYAMAIGLKAAG